MDEGGRRPEASSEVLNDYIHVVKLYLLDGLHKPPYEVSYGSSSCFKIVVRN